VTNVNKKNELIGICGWVGSGKDTAANYLVGWHGFRRDSFAGALKDAVAAVFGWDRELLEGLTTEARAWREQVDPWWAERLNMPHLTPRWVLQYWGTEVCRQGFHDDIWIAALENRLRQRTGHTVISDVRFPNEVASIRNAGGHIVWIRRGADPEWCSTLIEMRRNSTLGICTDYMQQFNVHASEWAWVGTEFDAVIDNNGSVEQLYENLKNLV
jgi:hypothetical protein